MIFKRGEGKTLKKLWELTSIGFVIPVSIAVGLAIGYYLDKLFKSFPWLTVIFTLFGIAAGFYSMLDMIKKSG